MLAALLLTLAVQSTPPSVPPANPAHPKWLVGEWGDISREPGSKPECGDHSVSYYAEGYFDALAGSGIWTYDGRQLCQTILIDYMDERAPIYKPGKTECTLVKLQGKRLLTQYDRQWWPSGRCGPAVMTAKGLRELNAAKARYLRARKR